MSFISRNANRSVSQLAHQAQLRNAMTRNNKGWSTTGKVLTGAVVTGAAIHATPLLEQWFGKFGTMRTHKYTEKLKDLYNDITGVTKKEKGNGFFAFCKSIPEAMKQVFYPHKWFKEKPVDLGQEIEEMENAIKADGKTLPDR
jgi:hypothetical protein